MGGGGGDALGGKNKGSGFRNCPHCGVYCHWTQKCCDKTSGQVRCPNPYT
jgi:hypothetical protein